MPSFLHDGAVVLMEDGAVVAAIEEERLNRIKHSNKFPLGAMRFCLEERGVRIQDVDCFAFCNTEEFWNSLLTVRRGQSVCDVRSFISARIEEEFSTGPAADRIVFVRHHVAHAASAFGMSGFPDSLIVTFDGMGDQEDSGLIACGTSNAISEIRTLSLANSLGGFYLSSIQVLGYGPFEEYKVMGLAPYGNPAAYRRYMAQCYRLRPKGEFEIFRPLGRFEEIPKRKRGEPLTQAHRDFAASLQEALEVIVRHVTEYFRETTGMRNLSLAGGVAQNCSANGRLLCSGLFDAIFVQPAAYDAGCALGAALVASGSLRRPQKQRVQHVYWGSDVGTDKEIESELASWRGFITFEKSLNITDEAAKLIADGAVIGWVQGRSEFGPRALGNRSILADPRPAENKSRINGMVKKREAYRPFAPSILEERVEEYFEIPASVDSLPFMTFVVGVREHKRPLLGAVTHVDGTARVQTVSRETNRRYWDLIAAFERSTGVPILLNTSFNNNVEPIVDSVRDAVVCFLTAGLDYLVIGDFVVRKADPTFEDWQRLYVFLPSYVELDQRRAFDGGNLVTTARVFRAGRGDDFMVISPWLCRALMKVDRPTSFLDMIRQCDMKAPDEGVLLREVRSLWEERLLLVGPKIPESRHFPEALQSE